MNKEIIGAIREQEVVELLQKMVRMNTVNAPGNEKPLAEFLSNEMKSCGIESRVVDIEENRANVVGIIKGSGERDALLFNGHLDTVPPGDVEWEHGPFSGAVVDGKLYGRGSADMKGGLAAMIIAAKIIKENGLDLKGDLIISGTAGEETDSIGAFDFLQKGGLEGVGAIVIGEPSSCEINVAEKGAFWVEITTYGKTAHGAFPHKGINAIEHMNALLGKLFEYKFDYNDNVLLGYPTMNISTISGGVKTNVVPDKCSLTIDMRTVPGMVHSEIVRDFEGIIEGLKKDSPEFSAEVKVLNDRPSVETLGDHPFVSMCCEVIMDEFEKNVVPRGVNFYTDASVFLPATNLPAVFYGPGDAHMAHQPNEYTRIEELVEAVMFYVAIAKKYLT